MDTTTLVIVVAVVIVAAIVIVFALQSRRSKTLRSRFGPEYERALDETGGKRKAEAELHQREKRVEALNIQPLTVADRTRFVSAWRRVQAEFVDNPKASVAKADDLLGEVMATRGYPMSDFDQRSADLSVDHPVVVDNYRAAHDIALRHGKGEAGTEDLRQAMIHYRALFDDLVEDPGHDHVQAAS